METGFYVPGVATNGRLVVLQPARYRAQIAALEGRKLLLHIMPVGSVSLKRFYYSVVLRIVGEHTGYTKAEANVEMKKLFLPEELVHQASIAHLTTSELQDLIADIQRWAAEGGLRADRKAVYIPDPNEVTNVA